MQLKIKRSQRDGGIISKLAVFMLDARVVFTQTERQNVDRYKLWNEHIYSSESAKKSWINAELSKDGSTAGGLKTLTHSLIAAFKLNVTVSSIFNGQHIECKSLDELIYAEECIKTACKTLREYLDVAATFNGSEVLYEIESGETKVIARSVSPDPALLIDTNAPAIVEADYEEISAEVEALKVQPMAQAFVDDVDTVAAQETAEPKHADDKPFSNFLTGQARNAAIGIGLALLIFFVFLLFMGNKHTPGNVVESIPPGYDGPIWYKDGKIIIPEHTANGYTPPCPNFGAGEDQGPNVAFKCID